jgi:hypothetical protein
MNMANLTSSQIGRLLNHSGPLWLRDLHLSGADLTSLIWANLREADRVYPELMEGHQTEHNMNSCQVRRLLSHRAQPDNRKKTR